MDDNYKKDAKTLIKLSLVNRLKFLLRDSMFYGGALGVSKAIGLITFPILARYFSVADYGIIDLFTIIASFITILFIFGQDTAVARFFYEYDSSATRKQIISESLLLQIVLLISLIPLLWLISGWIVPIITKYDQAEIYFKIVLLKIPFLLLINFSQNLLKWTFSRIKFMIMTLGLVIVNVTFLLIAIYVFNLDIKGALLVSLFSQMLFGVIGLFFIKEWIIIPKSLSFLRELIPFAIPYGIICAISSFVPALERSLVINLLGGQDLGLYAAGTKITLLVGVIIAAFQTAWGPFALSIYKHEDAAITYNSVFKGFSLAICGLTFFVSIIAKPLIILLARENYADAAVIVFPIAFGLAVQGIAWITEVGIIISKKSYLSIISYIVYIVITIGGIVLFSYYFGLIGVAIAVMLGQIAKTVSSSWMAQLVYPLSWEYRPVILLLSIVLLIGTIGVLSNSLLGNFMSNIIYGLGIIFTYITGWFILFTSVERKQILIILKDKFMSLRA